MTSAARCAHCGLPIPAARPAARGGGDAVFCCYGCYLVSRIIGSHDGGGGRTWSILRLGLGAFLSMEVMMVSLLLYTGTVEAEAETIFRWILLATSTPAMAILGYPFLIGAAGEARRRRLSLQTLIAVGSFAAYAASVAATISGRGFIYYDTATMLLALVTFGRVIESSAKARAGSLLRSLETLLPPRALRQDAGRLAEVAPAELRRGDLLYVRAGERFPADGVIRSGSTVIEEAAFTGEFLPRFAGPGDRVLAGTVNGLGVVTIEAEAVGEGLLLRRLVQMVDEAQQRTSSLQRLAARAATVLTPAVLLLAAATATIHLIAGNAAGAALAALAVLVVACPCAMGIAAPLATVLAIALAARAGVLVRGGDVLENAGRLTTLFLDKTGTVTTAQPQVQSVTVAAGQSETRVLSCLAAVESLSGHTLARAIVGEALRRGLTPGLAWDVQVFPGQGISGRVTCDGQTCDVRAGSAAFVARNGPMECGGDPMECGGNDAALDRQHHKASGQPAPEHAFGPAGLKAWHPAAGLEASRPATGLEAWDPAADPATIIHVAIDGSPAGCVTVTDALRPDAAESIARLHGMGVRTVLLSGDRQAAARAAAAELGIGDLQAPRRPHEKIAAIDAARAGGGVIGMAGDGVNDAPSLAAADVGFALASGSDLARQAGNIVLLGEGLSQIPWLIALSRRTRKLIKQNLAWAVGYNAIALAAAAVGWLHPLLAALAMVVSSITVLGNSMKIATFPRDERQPPTPSASPSAQSVSPSVPPPNSFGGAKTDDLRTAENS